EAIGNSAVMVYAPPDDQFEIARLITGAAQAGAQTELIPLTTLDATAVADTLNKMFVDPKTGAGPFVQADTARNSIILKGTMEQVADAKAALKAIGEDASAGGGTMRIISLDKGSAASVAAELERMLKE